MRRAKSEYNIQTVTNALRLLEAFQKGEEFGVTELSRELGLHKNNVFRLLATLEQRGYVCKNPHTDRYRLGPSCVGIGESFARSNELVRRGQRVLEELAHETGETAHLGILQDWLVIHLSGVQSERTVITRLRVGSSLPAHCTALGKALVGCSPPEVLASYDRHIAERGLAALTESTIVDRDKLVEHLRTVGSRGWASDAEECERGLSCVAAPVLGVSGRVAAALSVSGPTFRMDLETMESAYAPAVVTAASWLSRDLGHPG